MTKSAAAATLPSVCLLLLVATLLPAALGHGSRPPPPLFVRVGDADDDGQFSPGGCNHASTQSEDQTCGATAQNVQGLDLLSLDVRESHLRNGTGAIDFLVGYQEGGDGVVQTVQIFVTAGGKDHVVSFAGPTGNYTSSTCAVLVGPYDFPTGDGEQKAVECSVPYASLGVNGTGDKLSAIHMESDVGSTKYDAWPGSWYQKDSQKLAPRIPDCDTGTTPPTCETPTADDPAGGSTTPFDFTLSGPATLLNVTLSETKVSVRPPGCAEPCITPGSPLVRITLTSVVANTTQVVTLNMTAPATIQASLDKATVIVGNATATATLNVVGATKDGVIKIVLTSDLGAYQVLTIPVTAPPPAPACPTASGSASATTTAASTCTSTSGTSSKASAAPEMLAVGMLVLGLAVVRRRAD